MKFYEFNELIENILSGPLMANRHQVSFDTFARSNHIQIGPDANGNNS